MEEDKRILSKEKNQIKEDLNDLQETHDGLIEHNNKLKRLNNDLNLNINDAGSDYEKMKGLVKQLQNMKLELEEELAASEEARESLKNDIDEYTQKIMLLEEDLFESKTI